MAATFLSSTPFQLPLFPRHLASPLPPSTPQPFLAKPLHKSTLLCSSSSSFTSAIYPIVTEEESSTAPPELESFVPGTQDPDFRGCKACGREEIEKGCNGEGRIQGGIATVPGFGWWPIKAFRPCPGFVASGGRYRRKGQSMDEVAFGRGEREMPTENIVKSKSSKRKAKIKET
ncbi:hypothetical protein Cni_G18082 [Canna indica]|uniref:Uncharacterized protein n=1 Tax=Canna indica TaxID=4628 RepID=A0AAQ3QFR4_9LILI|nr:hypothetical protein Cni_G18082 [Canna indica]